MDSRPIGVYDSGMGGISLLGAIRLSLPNESIIYLGDGKNCPYGDKSPAEVSEFAHAATAELLSRGCKMIVVACNTATSTAIGALREAHPDTPFVGMEPAIKPACESTRTGVVAVLATKRSLESDMFAHTVQKYAAEVEVVRQVGEGFVEFVEQGLEESDECYSAVKLIVDTVAAKGVDKIVLGCTHYPFLLGQLRRAVGSRPIDIIDPSPAIVQRIESLLGQFDIAAPGNTEAVDEFITFGDENYREQLIAKAMSLKNIL